MTNNQFSSNEQILSTKVYQIQTTQRLVGFALRIAESGTPWSKVARRALCWVARAKRVKIGKLAGGMDAIDHKYFGIAQRDVIGKELMIGLIGEFLEPGDEITGRELGGLAVVGVRHNADNAVFSEGTTGPAAFGVDGPPSVGTLMKSAVRIK
jgi:hypothetical protein